MSIQFHSHSVATWSYRLESLCSDPGCSSPPLHPYGAVGSTATKGTKQGRGKRWHQREQRHTMVGTNNRCNYHYSRSSGRWRRRRNTCAVRSHSGECCIVPCLVLPLPPLSTLAMPGPRVKMINFAVTRATLAAISSFSLKDGCRIVFLLLSCLCSGLGCTPLLSYCVCGECWPPPSSFDAIFSRPFTPLHLPYHGMHLHSGPVWYSRW